MELFGNFDLISFIKAAGHFGIFAIVFAESGLFFGFFFPGDSLLFTAGFLASQGYLNVWLLVIGSALAAIAGDNVGYAFGRRVGPKIFNREDSFFFHKDHLERARAFYERHGKKTIVFARFLPIVRTFAPIIAGVGEMAYRTFVFYNIIGGLLWTVGLSLLGYFLGRSIPDIDRYLLPIIAAIIVLSILPTFVHLAKDKRVRARIRSFLKW